MSSPAAGSMQPPRSSASPLSAGQAVRYRIALAVALFGFAVMTVATAIGILVVSPLWHLAMRVLRRDVAAKHWSNPALWFVHGWSWLWPKWLRLTLGIRFDVSQAPGPTPPRTVRLLLLAHPPAAPGMMLVGDTFWRVAQRRWFAPVKRELMALIRVPTHALGIILPIDRATGDAAVDAITDALQTVPLDGVCVAIFPEGHRISRARRESAWRFAHERGLEPMWHHLEPRPRGSRAMLRALRDRAQAEGLDLEVHFGRYGFDRPGWGEPDGVARSMDATMWWASDVVTDEALAVVEDVDAFAAWLRGRFVDADRRLTVSPFIDAVERDG